MRLLLLWLCFSGAYAGLSYTAPETNRTLTICTCAKCGSTSIHRGFYRALTRKEFQPMPVGNGTRTSVVQMVDRWKEHPDCTRIAACAESVQKRPPEALKPGDVTVVVSRDPIERYISAFSNKIACVGRPSPTTPRKAYRRTTTSARVLLSQAGLPPLEAGADDCLFWGEYIDALTRIRRLGLRKEVDVHFSPQPSEECDVPNATIVDIARFGELVHGLEGFGPVPSRYPKNLHLHVSKRKWSIKFNATALCPIVLPEYAALGRDVPPECDGGPTRRRQGSWKGPKFMNVAELQAALRAAGANSSWAPKNDLAARLVKVRAAARRSAADAPKRRWPSERGHSKQA